MDWIREVLFTVLAMDMDMSVSWSENGASMKVEPVVSCVFLVLGWSVSVSVLWDDGW